MDEETADLVLFIVMAALLFAVWIWNAVIKWKEGRTWHTWGCIVYGLSYSLLVCSNIIGYKVNNCRLPYTFITIVFWAYVLQLGAGIGFIINAYRKDHPNDNVL